MEWEPSAGEMAYAFHPGEAVSNGAGTLGGNGMKGTVAMPGNFWSEPESNGFQSDVRRVSPALYPWMEKQWSNAPFAPEWGAEARFVTNSPRSWRDCLLFNDDLPVVAVAGLVTKTGTFLAPDGAAGTTLAIVDLGFKPKAVLFWWGGSNSTLDQASNTQDTRFGMGFAASPSERGCHCSVIEDAVGTTNTSTLIRSDACIATVNPTAHPPSGLWDLLSFDSDGFTIVVDLDPPAGDNRMISFTALGGDDLTNVKGGDFAAPGAPGNAGVTGVGFQPDAVLLFFTGEASLPDEDFNARFGFGAAITAAQQAVVYGFSEDSNGTVNTERYTRFDECIFTQSNGSVVQHASLVSQDADGFTLNWIANTFTMPVLYLALKGGGWHVGNSATTTSTGAIPVTGFGFAPKGVMVASNVSISESPSGVAQPNLALSIGAAHGVALADQRAHGNFEEDGIGTSDPWFFIDYGGIYGNVTGPGIAGGMDVQSFDADGVTFEMLDADPTARVFWYLGYGDTVVIAGPSGLALLGVGV